MSILKQSPNASTLEQFIGLGSVKEERQIFGNKVVMQTLPSSVIASIMVQCSGLDMIARDRIVKIEILSRSIKSISDQSLIVEDLDDETDTKAERLDKIKKTIGKWEDELINVAFDEYNELLKIQKNFFDELKKKLKMKT